MYVFAKSVPDDEKWLRGGAYYNAYASVSVLALKGRSVYRIRETIPLPRCWFSWEMNGHIELPRQFVVVGQHLWGLARNSIHNEKYIILFACHR